MNQRFLCGLLTQAVVTGSVQFLAPNLALHLYDFGFPPEYISLCFCLPSILYATSAPFIYLLTARISKRLVIIIGAFMMAIGNFLIGTSEVLGVENNSNCILIGLCIIGWSASLMSIPCLPEMLETIEVYTINMDVDYDPDEANNVVSGLFVTASGLGEAIGPILASVLVKIFDFRQSQEMYAFLILLFALWYLFATIIF